MARRSPSRVARKWRWAGVQPPDPVGPDGGVVLKVLALADARVLEVPAGPELPRLRGQFRHPCGREEVVDDSQPRVGQALDDALLQGLGP